METRYERETSYDQGHTATHEAENDPATGVSAGHGPTTCGGTLGANTALGGTGQDVRCGRFRLKNGKNTPRLCGSEIATVGSNAGTARRRSPPASRNAGTACHRSRAWTLAGPAIGCQGPRHLQVHLRQRRALLLPVLPGSQTSQR